MEWAHVFTPPSRPAHCQGEGREPALGLPAPALPAEDAGAPGALPTPMQ